MNITPEILSSGAVAVGLIAFLWGADSDINSSRRDVEASYQQYVEQQKARVKSLPRLEHDLQRIHYIKQYQVETVRASRFRLSSTLHRDDARSVLEASHVLSKNVYDLIHNGIAKSALPDDGRLKRDITTVAQNEIRVMELYQCYREAVKGYQQLVRIPPDSVINRCKRKPMPLNR